jgi:hypothetical protein
MTEGSHCGLLRGVRNSSDWVAAVLKPSPCPWNRDSLVPRQGISARRALRLAFLATSGFTNRVYIESPHSKSLGCFSMASGSRKLLNPTPTNR